MKKNVVQSSKEKFPNSTIIEALCELYFSSDGKATNEAWDGKWFGRLLTELGKEYDMEPKLISGVQVQASIGGQSIVSSQPVAVAHMIYRHKSGSHLIQLTPWKLTINEIGKYDSWEIFFHNIKHAWSSLCNIIPELGIKRIGMRYINKIYRKNSEETIGDWIKDTGLVPVDVLEQKTNFSYRCELQKSDNMKLILALAEDKSSTPTPIFFDIDIVTIKDVNSSWEQLSIELNSIHDVIRTVFDAARTEKYTKFLRNKS